MAAQGSSPALQSIVVTVDGASAVGEATRYSVPATILPDGSWLAYLTPTAAGGDYTITAQCTKGCINTTSATIEHVTFGDVWYCAGQVRSWNRLLIFCLLSCTLPISLFIRQSVVRLCLWVKFVGLAQVAILT